MTVGGGGAGPVISGTLAAYGIEHPRLKFRSMADDEFTFEIKQNALLAPYLAWGETVNLFQTAGGVRKPWFQGIVTKTVIIGSAKTETVKYTVSGPWYQLRETVWQVPTECYDPTSCAPDLLKISKITLFQDPTLGTPITTGQQIENVILYALTVGIPISFGALPAFINVPFEECRELTLADTIRRCMQWSPDGVGWFDYSSGVPTFNANGRLYLNPMFLDLSQDNFVTEFDLTPRNDLVPSGVRFNYIGSALCQVMVPNGCVDPTTGVLNNSGIPVLSQGKVQVMTVQQDVAGAPDIWGAIIGSIDLQQLTGTTTETPPVGMAGAYFLSLITPLWEGSITTKEVECSGILRPGKTLNLLNGQAAWSTMLTPIQEVTEDLFTGETTANLGTPNHLTPQTFAWLLNMTARRGLVVSGLAAVATPNLVGGVNCQKAVNPETQKQVNKTGSSGTSKTGTSPLAAALGLPPGGFSTFPVGVCSGGQMLTLNLYGPTAQGGLPIG